MITRSLEALHERLVEYIEAAYHIADPFLLEQRAGLLAAVGTIRQPAYLESTKAYAAQRRFGELLSRLPPQAESVLRALVAELTAQKPPLLHDPPWVHQWEALETLMFGGQGNTDSIVVYTGTGSGKTECFTTPILCRLLAEAATARASFERRAVRALVLYPMNALVNDQLGRMRLLLGSDAVAAAFQRAAGRPVTFGQYTGRTPFSGLRSFDAEGDGAKMEAFKAFYMDTVLGPVMEGDPAARRLWEALRAKGRWPCKPELDQWFGGAQYGGPARWEQRLHPRPNDRELIARHEFYGYRVEEGGPLLGAPPDVLVTNYSMLEYMLMRPIEQRIFEETRAWLRDHSEQNFLLVLDEAHLYRGAQGTEVALLVRRLLERLGLSGDAARRVRVAITSASFSAGKEAVAFASQLVGFPEGRFRSISGVLDSPSDGAPAAAALASALATVDLRAFYSAAGGEQRVSALGEAPAALGLPGGRDWSAPMAVERALYAALKDNPTRKRAVALTQVDAYRIEDLGKELFPTLAADPAAQVRATEALVALCAFAREKPDGSNLLPSRVHSFHRGLPGLWLCVNPRCNGIAPERQGGVSGAMFAQPRDKCPHCDARVYELYTCRSCGAAYARGYASDWRQPTFIWQACGGGEGEEDVPLPVDLLLEPARGDRELFEVVDLNILTGVVVGAAGTTPGATRTVGLYRLGEADAEQPERDGRVFYRCGVCCDDATKQVWTQQGYKQYPRSPVEDHQTAGQEPFYALAHEQLLRQPPRGERPSFLEEETPLRGRKLLVFSDGRQRAARLAAEMGRASLRDAIRPLLIKGFAYLAEGGKPRPLKDAYAALLIGAAVSGAQIRSTDDAFDATITRQLMMAREVVEYDLDPEGLNELSGETVPPPAATALLRVIRDKHTGLQALALARLEPFGTQARNAVNALVAGAVPGLDEAARKALVPLWLGVMLEQQGCDIFSREQLEQRSAWLAGRPNGGLPRPFTKALQRALGSVATAAFTEGWLPKLREIFGSNADDKGFLRAARLILRFAPIPGALEGWFRCPRCSKMQPALLRPNAGAAGACVRCGSLGVLAPASQGEAQEQFLARKRFYRRGIGGDVGDTLQPIVAREHSAQLTGATDDAHTRAERYELAFQDITEPSVDGMRVPIDVLSCTTTMEVGIDIGSLSGVALRNMPPGRANYQQRAGRAGRRGSGVATVMAYADQDGHNQHFFENPQKLVKAPVPDPTLNLSNRWIARRHVNAFVLQRYLAARIELDRTPKPTDANLFGSLGSVASFLRPDEDADIWLADVEAWLDEPGVRPALKDALRRWVPDDVEGRDGLIDGVADDFRAGLRGALADAIAAAAGTEQPAPTASGGSEEAAVEDTDTSDSSSLLDKLLYQGFLPKYAFPTDLVAFHVFERTNGLDARKDAGDKVRYSPQRNLAMALSEYAPGKVVFIDGRAWRSAALISPVAGGLASALAASLYMRECGRCHYTALFQSPADSQGATCLACGDVSFGAGLGHRWLRPPGFGHPASVKPAPDADYTETARAGRAVLAAPSPTAEEWTQVSAGIQASLGRADRSELLVTNAGPQGKGFRLCTSCGAIEPALANRLASGDGHRKPKPSVTGWTEQCETPDYEVVRLGTRFRSDVLLLRLKLPPPQRLEYGIAFSVAMTSLTEALTLATCKVLEIEAGEVAGGYRHGFTVDGPEPDALEVFLYDQLAGGAGYVVEAKERLAEILGEARRILAHESGSATAPCDRACYGCLLSFKNSFEHHLYDRRLAIDLLDAVQLQRAAALDPTQQKVAYGLLSEWLRLSGLGEVVLDAPIADGEGAPTAPVMLRRANRRIVPALAHPFSPKLPCDAGLAEAMQMGAGLGVEILPLDFLDVTRRLPRAARQIEELANG